MTYGNNPPGGYEGRRPEDYGGPPPGGYGGQQGGYGDPQGGYGDPQQGGYGNPQQGGGYGGRQEGGYGGQQGGYGSPQQGGYGSPQQGGYGSPQQGGYGSPQQGGYGGQTQGGYGNPAGGYANPPGAYGNLPGAAGYGAAPGYPPAPGGYGTPGPAGYGGPQGYASPGNYASWLQRVGAYLIDVIPVAVLEGIGLATNSTGIYLVFILLALCVTGYNRWYQAGRTGQSWGKRALGITLLSEQTGQPIGAGMAFLRDICHIVDGIICYIGFLFPLWDAKRQTLADKIMRTVVVPA
jgi:uncharacterized RDD family membrane protein YckC